MIGNIFFCYKTQHIDGEFHINSSEGRSLDFDFLNDMVTYEKNGASRGVVLL